MTVSVRSVYAIAVFVCLCVRHDEAAFQHKYNVIVNTQHGPVEGFSIASHYSAYEFRRINVFLGVPYAKRKTQYDDWRRKFRFNKPEKPSWNGIWDATKYRPACPQLPWLVKQTVPDFERSKDTSEDCLYMNIFAPNNTKDIITSNPPLHPVMVFIHGGGWTMGASNQWPGMFLAERRVVVVTFNYRLNALGFLSTGDHYSPGNYGLWDQHRALEFVKDNIKAFRGDPGAITVFGQSTGAAAVGLHLLSPRSYKMFQRAIMMSGSDRCQWSHIPQIEDAQAYARNLATELGCPSNDHQRMVSCMQLYRSADEIVNASAKVRVKEGTVGNPWGPVVDGPFQGSQFAFLTDPPKSMREQDRFQKIQIMGGLVKDDGSFFIPNMPSLEAGLSRTQFDNIILEFLRDRNVADMVNAMEALTFEYSYWPQKDNYTYIRQELINMMSDYLFGDGMDQTLRSQNRHNKTFEYLFTYKSRYDFLPPWRGVAHGQDLPYVFGFPYINQTYKDLFGLYPRQEYDRDYSDRNVSEYMISLLTNFSNSGNPNAVNHYKENVGKTLGNKNTVWYEYNNLNHTYLEIGNKTNNKVNYRQRQYAFWREYFIAVSNRDSVFTTAPPSTSKDISYQTATWTLTALGVVLIITVIALGIVICRMRPPSNKRVATELQRSQQYSCRAEAMESTEETPLLSDSHNSQNSFLSKAPVEGNFSFRNVPRRKKFILVSLGFVNFCASCCFSLLAPFFPIEAGKKGASQSVVGMIFGAFELVIFISSPVFGNYISKIGCKFMFISGIMVCGVCAILFGLLDKCPDGTIFIVMCFLSRSVEALGCSAFVTALFAILAHEFPDNVITVMGSLETFSGLGMMVGPPIGGALYELGGYGLPFFVLGTVVIGCGALTTLIMPPIQDHNKMLSGSIFYLLRSPMVVVTFINITATCIGTGFFNPTLADHLKKFKLETWLVGLMFLIAPGVYALTAPIWGYVGDTKGYIRLLIGGGSFAAVFSFLLLGPAPFLTFIPQTLYINIIALAWMGLCIGCALIPTFKALLTGANSLGMPNDLDTYGKVSGFFNSSFSLGAFLGPTIGGTLVDKLGFPWACTGIAAMFLLAAFLMLVYRLCVPVLPKLPEEQTKEIDSTKTLANDNEDKTGTNTLAVPDMDLLDSVNAV